MINIQRYLPLIILTVVFGFIFFYRLDFNTLASFDEAWFGSIAKEIVKTDDFIDTQYNGKPFYDHPPMGYWLMAISYKIFGINEFSTRFPSALLGLLSILLIYKIGKLLFHSSLIGFVSALILGTSVWYVLRVRSGNLESIFVFFFLLTIFLSIKSTKNFRWFPLIGLSFGALMLTKTLIGISIFPLIILLTWKQILSIFQKRENFVWIIFALILFVGLVKPWYSFHLKEYSDFYNYHFIHIGMRDKKISSFLLFFIDQALFYLHMGVRKWYKLWQLSILVSILFTVYNLYKYFLTKKNNYRERIFPFFFVLTWSLIIIYPFLTAKETELWHLIPVYLPLSLLISASFYSLIIIFILNFKFVKLKKIKLVVPTLYLFFFLYLGFVQVKTFKREVFPDSKYIPENVDISKKLTKYKQKIYVENDYLPIAVFYSGKNVESLILEKDSVATFDSLFKINNGDVIGVTQNWVVEDLDKKNFRYKLLEKNSRYSIITKP